MQQVGAHVCVYVRLCVCVCPQAIVSIHYVM